MAGGDVPPADEGGELTGCWTDFRCDEVEAQEMCDQTFRWFLEEHDPDAKCATCKGPKPPRWRVGVHVSGTHAECAACEAETQACSARWNALTPEDRRAAVARAVACIKASNARRLGGGE